MADEPSSPSELCVDNFELPPGLRARHPVVRAPSGWVHVDCCGPTVCGVHRHPQLQVSIFLEKATGLAKWQLPDGRWCEIELAAGMVWMVPPGVPHEIDWRRDAAFITLYVEEPWATGIAGQPVRHISYEPLDRYEEAEPLIGELIAIFHPLCRAPGPVDGGEVASLAPALADRLLRAHFEPCRDRHPKQWLLPRAALADVREYIEKHLAEKFSLRSLAKLAGLSPSYFGQLFRAAVGVPPQTFLINLRVRRARTLLRTGDHTLADVAAQVGFPDQQQMNHHFRRLLNASPSSYLPSGGTR